MSDPFNINPQNDYERFLNRMFVNIVLRLRESAKISYKSDEEREKDSIEFKKSIDSEECSICHHEVPIAEDKHFLEGLEKINKLPINKFAVLSWDWKGRGSDASEKKAALKNGLVNVYTPENLDSTVELYTDEEITDEQAQELHDFYYSYMVGCSTVYDEKGKGWFEKDGIWSGGVIQ